VVKISSHPAPPMNSKQQESHQTSAYSAEPVVLTPPIRPRSSCLCFGPNAVSESLTTHDV